MDIEKYKSLFPDYENFKESYDEYRKGHIDEV